MRTFPDPGIGLIALRWPAGREVGPLLMGEWHRHGVRLLAVAGEDGKAKPPASATAGIGARESGVLIGADDAIAKVRLELERRRR